MSSKFNSLVKVFFGIVFGFIGFVSERLLLKDAANVNTYVLLSLLLDTGTLLAPLAVSPFFYGVKLGSDSGKVGRQESLDRLADVRGCGFEVFDRLLDKVFGLAYAS